MLIKRFFAETKDGEVFEIKSIVCGYKDDSKAFIQSNWWTNRNTYEIHDWEEMGKHSSLEYYFSKLKAGHFLVEYDLENHISKENIRNIWMEEFDDDRA